ncbi:[4Fe-4S]-AdoMet protein YtqA [Oscillospiraceae bacterium]|nr:[4Fe-4S]-AdoMet protein YtqA [Oscillospiraceae bacterium]
MEHYTALSPYLKRRFGCKVYKLSLSAGCTCPNRDGTLGTRGCIFCSGSGEFAASGSASIPEQLEQAKYILGKKAQGAKFIAYFQDFTNTYGAVSRLEPLFLAAMEPDDVVALSIATRPDCLPEDILRMLARLRAKKPVFVELGLQTIHDNTAQYIRRGYPLSVFDDAVQKLHVLEIEVIAHQILGLPGETAEMMAETTRHLGSVHVDGVKLHLLHILRGTDLAREYADGRIQMLELDAYIDILEQCLAVLPPDVVIHRLTGDGAKRDLIAPLWSADKKRVLSAIQKRFEQDGVMQGSALRG